MLRGCELLPCCMAGLCVILFAGKLADAESMVALKDLANRLGSGNTWHEGGFPEMSGEQHQQWQQATAPGRQDSAQWPGLVGSALQWGSMYGLAAPAAYEGRGLREKLCAGADGMCRIALIKPGLLWDGIVACSSLAADRDSCRFVSSWACAINHQLPSRFAHFGCVPLPHPLVCS